MKLTTGLISEIYPDLALQELKDINVSNKGIITVEDLSACKKTRKMILSKNRLEDENSIAGLNDLKEMILLNLSNNQFKDFTGFQHFTSLNVLNVSHNALVHMSPHLRKLRQLKALILNNNQLLEIENIETLLDLNTLVVSHNQLDKIPTLSSLLKLTKLSAAHNKLTVVPDMSHNTDIKELRLNDNQIAEIPESLRKCSAIEVLDFGNNKISDWTAIASLGSLTKLNNLNLKGNPLAAKKDYLEKVLDLVPSLRVLDGERFDPKFLERKKKKLQNTNIVEKMQRMKRMKVQKEKRENKDNKVEERPKRANEHQEPERIVKKKKVEENAKDDFFVKPSDAKLAKSKSIKKRPAEEPATKEPTAKKTTTKKLATNESDSKKFAAKEPVEKKPVAKEPVAKKTAAKAPIAKKAATKKSIEKPAVERSAEKKPTTEEPAKPAVQENKLTTGVTKAQTGVLGVIDKTKKKKEAGKKTQDIFATLETEDKTDGSSGTGLGVGGWD